VDVGGREVQCLRPQSDVTSNSDWRGQLTVYEPLDAGTEIKLKGFKWKDAESNGGVFPEQGTTKYQDLQNNSGLVDPHSIPTLEKVKEHLERHENMKPFKLPGRNFMELCDKDEAMSLEIFTGLYSVTLTVPQSCKPSGEADSIHVKMGDSEVYCSALLCGDLDEGKWREGTDTWCGNLYVIDETISESAQISLMDYRWNGKVTRLQKDGLMHDAWPLPTLGDAQTGAVRFKLPEVMDKCNAPEQAMSVYVKYTSV